MTPPAFTHYSSITNHYREPFIVKVQETAPESEQWSASEKIHGCNFSFILTFNPNHSDSNDVQIEIARASRNQILLPNENFYRVKDLQKRYHAGLMRFYYLLKTYLKCDQLTTVQLIGEIYGGGYNGQKGLSKSVQKEIQYCVETDFRIFDILVSNPTPIYQNFNDMIELLKESELPYSPVLHRGTLAEMLALEPCFPSTIPALHGLDSIANNNAEGYVLKPDQPRWLGDSRVILKLKNPKFSEKETSKPLTKEQTNIDLPENIKNDAIRYVNQNRLDAVLSKMTETQQLNKSGMIQAMIRDVIEEVSRDHSIDKVQSDQLKKVISKDVALLVMSKI